jgi:hypothetical protein
MVPGLDIVVLIMLRNMVGINRSLLNRRRYDQGLCKKGSIVVNRFPK